MLEKVKRLTCILFVFNYTVGRENSKNIKVTRQNNGRYETHETTRTRDVKNVRPDQDLSEID